MGMSESAYVAIGIACVVATLLIIVLIVYCVKHQHDKEDARRRQEEMQRRERHRRHLMRTTIVRPPAYEANARGHPNPALRNEPIPMSPPPAYKERATPYPQAVGIGGIANPPPNYEPIPTVSRNVPPANTTYASNDPYINYLHSRPAVANSNNYINSGYVMSNNQAPGTQLITRPVQNGGGQIQGSSVIVVNPTANGDRASSRAQGLQGQQDNTIGRNSRMTRDSEPSTQNARHDSRSPDRAPSANRSGPGIRAQSRNNNVPGVTNPVQASNNSSQSQDPFRQAVQNTQYYTPSTQERPYQSLVANRGQYSYPQNNAANSQVVEDLSLI